jgi:hypothetical protein
VTPATETRVAEVTRLGLEAPEPLTDPNQPAFGRTTYASRSALVAALVQREFAQKRYGGPRGRALKVAAPDGPSTDGGLKARQALLLVPARGEGPALQTGWMDAARMVAHLRSWEAVRVREQARFGKDPDLGEQAYQTFLMELRRALIGHGMDVHLVVPDDAPTPGPAPVPGVPLPKVAALAIAALIVGLWLGTLL